MKGACRQRGVSLIEVLVAIVVFSVGVLGLALMQIKGAQFTKQAGARSYAIMQASSLIDAMRSNAEAAEAPLSAANPSSPSASECPYCFDGKTAPAVVDCQSSCTSAQTASNDLAQWMAQLKRAVPGPSTGVLGTVSWNANLGMYVITVRWAGGSMNGSAPSGDSDLSYTLTYLP